MTKFKSILAAVALAAFAVGASGCSTIGRLTSNEQVATYDERALITAELAYGFLLTAVNQAAALGMVGEEEAAQILPVLQSTQAAVVRARAVYDAGNAADAALATQDAIAQVAALTALLEQLGVIRRNGG